MFRKLIGLILALAIAGMVTAAPIRAQEFPTLSEIVNGDHEASYPYVRCAALYYSTIQWDGNNQFGIEVTATSEQVVAMLMEVAKKIRLKQSGNDISTIQDQVARDIASINDIYLNRYQENYSRTGQAFEGDSLYRSDLQLCGVISEDAIKQLANP